MLPLVLSFSNWSAAVGGLWLVRSDSSCLFDTGQSPLVDFGLCAMHGDIDRHVTCTKTFDTM